MFVQVIGPPKYTLVLVAMLVCTVHAVFDTLQLCADSENSLLLKLNPVARTSQVCVCVYEDEPLLS
jgi:hypothetical protein